MFLVLPPASSRPSQYSTVDDDINDNPQMSNLCLCDEYFISCRKHRIKRYDLPACFHSQRATFLTQRLSTVLLAFRVYAIHPNHRIVLLVTSSFIFGQTVLNIWVCHAIDARSPDYKQEYTVGISKSQHTLPIKQWYSFSRATELRRRKHWESNPF